MKKLPVIIICLLILGFISILVANCQKDNCNNCQITQAEESFIVYSGSATIVFKNDTTGMLDTMRTSGAHKELAHCSLPCEASEGSVYCNLTFSHLAPCIFSIYHGSNATAYYEY